MAAAADLRSTVRSWKSAYETCIKEVADSGSDGISRFVVILSKPTATQPIPLVSVNLMVEAHPAADGGQPTFLFSFENETHKYRLEDGFAQFVDTLADRIIDRKILASTTLDVTTGFDRTRTAKR